MRRRYAALPCDCLGSRPSKAADTQGEDNIDRRFARVEDCWAAAFGRIGSIVGRAVGGGLLSLGWPARDIVLAALIPASIAIAVLSVLGALKRMRFAT